MKYAFLIPLVLSLLMIPILADAYGIAITPTDINACVIHSQVSNVTFYVSKSADVTEGYIEVYIENISWVYGPQYLELPEGTKQTKLNLTIMAPQDIEYGVRHGTVMVCTPPTTDFGNSIQPCVEAILNIDVEETCPDIEAKKNSLKITIENILLAMIFVLLLVFGFRKVSKMRNKPKPAKKRKK